MKSAKIMLIDRYAQDGSIYPAIGTGYFTGLFDIYILVNWPNHALSLPNISIDLYANVAVATLCALKHAKQKNDRNGTESLFLLLQYAFLLQRRDGSLDEKCEGGPMFVSCTVKMKRSQICNFTMIFAIEELGGDLEFAFGLSKFS